jgi:hypothetical protein
MKEPESHINAVCSGFVHLKGRTFYVPRFNFRV